MSIATTPLDQPLQPGPRKRRKLSVAWLLIGFAVFMLLMSLLRVATGANDLNSSGTIRATVIAAIPIGLAGLGGLWSERAGIVNIGLEGLSLIHISEPTRLGMISYA